MEENSTSEIKHKILIVEDDKALQTALAEVLVNEGYEVICALDGQEGLEKYRTIHPDLVLLDIILPKMDGYEVLSEIRKDEEKRVPVLILTNLEEVNHVQKALSLGATTFMIKSDFSLKDVVSKVKENLKI